ncbi:helix-turn-helix domain-containing protein [Fructobacillus tropaeoli]|uniref:helix-turn-helix domain-containing protein n=1 Tax=Fructobacillus tropaeoli TaxID=709323 RepID=UPI001455FDD2|nr:Rgg/GadR/MutR family transcriptional regulator [Fructobacillus tropaeoli]NLS38091.1 helix-turn-helix domain-containing protein [Fructobacillus tropaeoli]
MAEIGEVFKTFRKGKNITLKEASSGIVSYTFLSKFERGLTDISFMHLLELLDRINVQLSEFEFSYQKSNNYLNDFLPSLQKAYQSSDIDSLNDHLRRWQNKSDKFSKLQAIQIKMMLTTLGKATITGDEINTLQNYFQSITNWTFFELYLFGHAIPFFEERFMLNLFLELQKKAILYDLFRYDSFSMLFYIYNNMILHMLEQKNAVVARQLLDNLISYFQNQKRDYYHRARLLNLKGLTLYIGDNKESGLMLIKKSNVITFLIHDDAQFVLNEKNYLSKFLSKDELEDAFNFKDIDLIHLNSFD